MRQTERSPSPARSFALAGVAVVGGVAALCLVVAVVIGGLLVGAMSSLGDIRIDVEPVPVGVTAGADGAPVVVPGSCGPFDVRSVRLLTPGGAEAWRADALPGTAPGSPPARIPVGAAPPGFTDVVPLAAPLDPATTYRVEVAAIDPGILDAGPDDPSVAPSGTTYALLGGEASFRPDDLIGGTVWIEGAAVAEAEFDAASCRAAAAVRPGG